MKIEIEVSFETTMEEIWEIGRQSLLNPKKELPELCDALDVLKTWRLSFENKYGALRALHHHSNPDDPPDAVAIFERGCLDVEHTIIEPPHVKHGEAIHRNERPLQGSNGIPLSGSYSAAELREIMWTPSHPQAWENTDESLSTRYDLIVSAIANKIAKYPPGGLLVMRGDVGCFPAGLEWEIDAIKVACYKAKNLPGSSRWQFAIHNRWNSCEFFSGLFCPELGFQWQRKTV